MPVTASQIRRGHVRPAKLNVTLEGGAVEEVNLRYRPAAYTADDEIAIASAPNAGVQGRLIIGVLAKMIESWDVVDAVLDEHGNPVKGPDGRIKTVPFPPTPQNLGTMPSQFLKGLMDAIQEDMRPGEASEPTSLNS